MGDIRSLDLNLLKTLDALLETRSVTAAAARLGLTQPTVSGMLARLREAFGDPLFVRTRRGITPTLRAEALAGPLKTVLQDVNTLLQPAAFNPATAQRTISIAATDYAQRVLVLPCLAILRREAPGMLVSLRPMHAEDMAGQMGKGRLDLALTTPDSAADQLKSRRLFDEHYVLALRQGHPAARRALDLDLFCQLDHAIMSHDGTRFRGATDQALETIGRGRKVVASVPSFTILLDLVKSTDCCALLPSRLVKGETGLTVMNPPIAIPPFTKILVWHERSQTDPAMIWLRERLARIPV